MQPKELAKNKVTRRSSFTLTRVFLEKLIERPEMIEKMRRRYLSEEVKEVARTRKRKGYHL